MNIACWPAAIGGVLLAAASLFAAQPAENPAAAEPVTHPDAMATAPVPVARVRLLRESSHLVQAAGTIRRDDRSGWWIFSPQVDAETTPAWRNLAGYELRLLPCTFLGSMERMVQSMPGENVVFEVSGEVFVHGNRNYLLPTQPPLLVGYSQADANASRTRDDREGAENEDNAPDMPDATSTVTRPDESVAAASPRTGGESVDELASRLDAAVGPLVAPIEASSEEEDESVSAPIREGTMLIAREGRVGRDSVGSWIFVFDADAEGHADPPMTLVPCLLLEQITRHARNAQGNAPVMLSGRVLAYRGRNFLLPTVFQVPRHDTPLRP